MLWRPQPGPQTYAATSPCDVTLFGGTRGGGKSDCLLGRQLRGAEQWGEHWNGLIVRRKYKEFAELRRRIDELIRAGLPAERIGGDQQTNYVRFSSGAKITLAAIMRADMIDDYQGHQYTEVSIDEGTTFPFFFPLVDRLKGSLRSPHGVPCHMFITGNPGGPGHMQVKQMLVDPAETGKVFYNDAGESYVFIKSFLRDNKILYENDPKYVRRLLSITDEALRRAWLQGDWDVFIGQAFGFQEAYHVIDPLPIPAYGTLITTFDWGYGKPFSWGWWWMDNDGRVYRFAEWYGWNGQPNEGLRMPDSEIAEGIHQREAEMGLAGRRFVRYAGPDCFAKKPNYQGGGQGPSTAETFAASGLMLQPGDPDRASKIRQFRERLRVRVGVRGQLLERPMLLIYKTCKQFVRTIPALCVDDSNPEDIDTEQEDHVYDEACHIAMAHRLKEAQGLQVPSAIDEWFRHKGN